MGRILDYFMEGYSERTIIMYVKIPEYIYNEYIKQDNIDVIIDSGNIVLHKTKLKLNFASVLI